MSRKTKNVLVVLAIFSAIAFGISQVDRGTERILIELRQGK
ncbi:MAG: hypothetical protein Q8O51_00365 [bacterium]|nr:hypothetical protein [bacterium]